MVEGFSLDGPRVEPAAGGDAGELVVLLHGLGADGHDLIELAPALARVLPRAAFVAPHAPFPCDMAPMGRQWFSLREVTNEALTAGVRMAAPILEGFLEEELGRRDLGWRRLALVGFSQGSMLALYLALRREQACAALVAFSGALVGAERLAREIRSRPPVLLVHGEADEVVPARALPAAVSTLEACGVPVESELRPGLGHGIDERGLELACGFLGRHLAGKSRR